MSNPVYGKQIKTSSKAVAGLASPLQWTLTIGLILFLLWSAFQVALFNGQTLQFEGPIYWAIAITTLLFTMWVAVYFKQIKLETQQDCLKIAVILLPLTYVLSLISAASEYLAVNMILIQCMYAMIFVMAMYLLQNNKINHIIQSSLIGIAYVIVGFGLLNWLGAFSFAGKLVGWFSAGVVNGVYNQAIWNDSNGPRLASVFQYPNTYAAFLIPFLFITIFSMIRSKKVYMQLLHGFMLVPIILSLLLTLSRTGLVMLPIVFVILLLLLKPAKQILWFIYCGVAGIGTIIVLNPINTAGLELQKQYSGSLAAKGWIYLIAASVVVTLLCWVIQRWVAPRLEGKLQSWSDRKGSSLWIPLGSVVLTVIVAVLLLGTSVRNILPDSISTRLENINFQQHSVLERITFYKDAMKLVADYPIIGAGGGAWTSLYEKYQNNPYISAQAHNFFMQYLVEVGIIGFVVFMAFILFVFYQYVRAYVVRSEEERESHFVYFILSMSILVLSILDFNMSYVFIGILVFLGLGGMAAAMDPKPMRRLKLSDSTARGIYSVIAGVAVIILLIVSVRFLQANHYAYKAKEVAQTSQDFQEIKAPLDKDLSIRSTHFDSLLMLSSLYQQGYEQTKDDQFYTASVQLLQRGLEAEPFNKSMVKQLISLYELKGEADQAYTLQKEYADNYAWDMSWYEQLISRSFDLGYQAVGQGDTAKKESYFASGLDAYQHVVDGIAHLKTLPEGQMQGEAFELTPTMILNSGKMKYMLNDAAGAAAILKGGIAEDLTDATNREIARWYLAVLAKEGQQDQAVYDKLIAVAPTEADEIKKISELNF
ncbi:O-antigen ligase family protein [Paenibacillus sp. JNUCC31]|uniref:O-antigen ligase family protein n=1 Tax=Paenibacillus sp. JNUCC-31 TaxID=2777983 RepID=UPI001785E505|nr:O-antigen ligase family protein [Paenibacillus sp. JNUCC-31]QOS81367.1 O-antigen ligase family protein [Paenibacillus sp. JNUCC-31]